MIVTERCDLVAAYSVVTPYATVYGVTALGAGGFYRFKLILVIVTQSRDLVAAHFIVTPYATVYGVTALGAGGFYRFKLILVIVTQGCLVNA